MSHFFAFGEVLWDVYPTEKYIGGAPFNFATHLSYLNANAYLISAVGNDELGEQTVKSVKANGISADFLSHNDYITGECTVTLEGAIPKYDLKTDTAYDNIALTDEMKEMLKGYTDKSLYFGTLAMRSSVSGNTLRELVTDYEWKNIYYDINIRKPNYSKENILFGLKSCTVFKFSREEAPIFNELELTSVKKDDFSLQTEYFKSLCTDLAQKYNIEDVVMTLDKDGAAVYNKSTDKFVLSEKSDVKVVSTVGAGDSFFATFSYFKDKNEDVADCINKAVLVSGYVCTKTESAPQYTDELKRKIGLI